MRQAMYRGIAAVYLGVAAGCNFQDCDTNLFPVISPGAQSTPRQNPQSTLDQKIEPQVGAQAQTPNQDALVYRSTSGITLIDNEISTTYNRRIPFRDENSTRADIVYTFGQEDCTPEEVVDIARDFYQSFALAHANGSIGDLSGDSLFRFIQTVDSDQDLTITLQEVQSIDQDFIHPPRRRMWGAVRSPSSPTTDRDQRQATSQPYRGRNSSRR